MHRMATKKKMLGRTSRGQATLNCNSNILVWQRIQNVCMCVCVRASDQFAPSRSLGLAFYTTKVKYLKTKASRKLAKRNGGDQNTDNHFVLFLSIVGFALHVRLNTRVYVCVFVQRSMLWVSVNIVLNILLFVFRKNPLTTALSFCL